MPVPEESSTMRDDERMKIEKTKRRGSKGDKEAATQIGTVGPSGFDMLQIGKTTQENKEIGRKAEKVLGEKRKRSTRGGKGVEKEGYVEAFWEETNNKSETGGEIYIERD